MRKELTTERDEIFNWVLNTFLDFALKTLLNFSGKLFSKNKDNENFPKHKKYVQKQKGYQRSEYNLLFCYKNFCFAVINSVAAITLNALNDARAEFFRDHIFKMKMVDNFRW